MKPRIPALLLIGLALSACAAKPPAALLIRTDGQPIRGNQRHEAALQVDSAICHGERQKAHMSGVTFSPTTVGAVIADLERTDSADAVLAGCFAQRGYVIVPAAEADARAATYRELAASGGGTATGSIATTQAQR